MERERERESVIFPLMVLKTARFLQWFSDTTSSQLESLQSFVPGLGNYKAYNFKAVKVSCQTFANCLLKQTFN